MVVIQHSVSAKMQMQCFMVQARTGFVPVQEVLV